MPFSSRCPVLLWRNTMLSASVAAFLTMQGSASSLQLCNRRSYCQEKQTPSCYNTPEVVTVKCLMTQWCLQVWGNLVGFIERLDDELFKSLQVLDPHTNLYLERMKDEPLFLALAQKVKPHPHLLCCCMATLLLLVCLLVQQLLPARHDRSAGLMCKAATSCLRVTLRMAISTQCSGLSGYVTRR